MNQVFYRHPIRFGPIMVGQEMPTCGVGTSIAQVLYLLLHTRYGELRSDRSFGCKIWDFDYDRTVSNTYWVTQLCESLEAAIQRHERRLTKPQVSVQFQPVEHRLDALPEDYQQLATVTISATLVETEEPFRFTTQLHLGHLSTR
ncbi:GPW/gp25 family protein [Spirosoma linguale]|uniref:GPW/gp25 family protein n=1 Tax=Spirosoma linguale (strain ATCC 33905 / DSM 74 / LMG 10896 / Claus 1) TaxID=504472 RepID=D2QJP9_SPILD|nr:GPW/gp25 family protein [Spirosoma linguale DSM 74]